VHPGSALWAGRGEHQAAHERRTDQRELLRDEAADREREQVELD
jgi:hypothetical protein